MTHDPLCTLAPYWAKVVEQGGRLPTNPDACPTCELIAKVRADQDRNHWDKTKHLRDRIERLVTKANRWRDENTELRARLKGVRT